MTVHWKTDKWIMPQIQYIEKYTHSQYRLYAFFTDVNYECLKDKFYHVSEGPNKSHPRKLNKLADIACTRAMNASDWLVFIDSDAFLIDEWIPYIADLLEDYPLIAVRRDENLGDPQPHPCFCVTTVGFWREIRGTWEAGFKWKNNAGDWIADVGGILLQSLIEKNIVWFTILRSNKKNLHPVFFGVYDGIIYHHGSGSRSGLSRREATQFRGEMGSQRQLLPGLFGVNTGKVQVSTKAERLSEVEAISSRVFEEIVASSEFYRQFL
ncbi:MAG: hypothetical protein WD036_03450 [Bauldia sp.]